jgi:hypothetical protein
LVDSYILVLVIASTFGVPISRRVNPAHQDKHAWSPAVLADPSPRGKIASAYRAGVAGYGAGLEFNPIAVSREDVEPEAREIRKLLLFEKARSYEITFDPMAAGTPRDPVALLLWA